MAETQPIRTAEPEQEPEYVGTHSMLVSEECGNVYDGDPENTPHDEFVPVMCDRDATHTVVMADGSGLHEVAMCDECGEPDDVDRGEREWTGEVRESSQTYRREVEDPRINGYLEEEYRVSDLLIQRPDSGEHTVATEWVDKGENIIIVEQRDPTDDELDEHGLL